MLAGHVVCVNKTKFVITKKGAVEIKNVTLHTKIQKLTYQNVLIELEGYLSNPNHPKYHIARYISSLRNITDSQMKSFLDSDSKYLLNTLLKDTILEADNKYVFSKHTKESLALTIYNPNRFNVIVFNRRDAIYKYLPAHTFDPP
jgi:subtilase family serine protease